MLFSSVLCLSPSSRYVHQVLKAAIPPPISPFHSPLFLIAYFHKRHIASTNLRGIHNNGNAILGPWHDRLNSRRIDYILQSNHNLGIGYRANTLSYFETKDFVFHVQNLTAKPKQDLPKNLPSSASFG